MHNSKAIKLRTSNWVSHKIRIQNTSFTRKSPSVTELCWVTSDSLITINRLVNKQTWNFFGIQWIRIDCVENATQHRIGRNSSLNGWFQFLLQRFNHIKCECVFSVLMQTIQCSWINSFLYRNFIEITHQFMMEFNWFPSQLEIQPQPET